MVKDQQTLMVALVVAVLIVLVELEHQVKELMVVQQLLQVLLVVVDQAQQEAMEREAELRRLEAQTQELQRRQELNRRLAAEQVAMASGGIATEGTPASIALKSAEQMGISETTIGLSEALAERQLRRKGKVAASAGKTTAATSLLGTGTEIARILG